MNLGLFIPVILFLVLGVVGLYALQVAKNVAYVAFVIMFGMLTWYVGAPLIRHYVFNEQTLSALPPEEGKVARDIVDHFNNLPSREQMEEAAKPALDAVKKETASKDSGEMHAAATEETQDGEKKPTLINKIMKAVFQTIADSF
ncbi:MAG TPA: hypothetical protein PKV72_00850 [Candidatus Peribacteria bacterium]|nr:hypothetical protein [Candidatus Peribacteria bacterium]